MCECRKYEFLIESKEVNIYTLSIASEIDTVLKRVLRQTLMQILRENSNFEITEDGDNSELTRYREKLNIFNGFVAKAIISMTQEVDNPASSEG